MPSSTTTSSSNTTSASNSVEQQLLAATLTKDAQAYRLASRLMQLLNEESVLQSLWWLSDEDDTFAVDPRYFQSQVLDPHFRGTKYASFIRTMHKMGFSRISRNFDLAKGVVAYSCELFRKGQPELMHQIRMNNSAKQAQAARAAKTQQTKDHKDASKPKTATTKVAKLGGLTNHKTSNTKAINIKAGNTAATAFKTQGTQAPFSLAARGRTSPALRGLESLNGGSPLPLQYPSTTGGGLIAASTAPSAATATMRAGAIPSAAGSFDYLLAQAAAADRELRLQALMGQQQAQQRAGSLLAVSLQQRMAAEWQRASMMESALMNYPTNPFANHPRR